MRVRHLPKLASLLALSVALSAGIARAEEGSSEQSAPPAGSAPNPNTNPGTNPKAFFDAKKIATIGLGLGTMDGTNNVWLQLRPYVEFDFGKIGIGALLPVNLLMPIPSPDEAYKKDKTYGGWLRKSDYPKPDNAKAIGQYLQLIRMFRYGQPSDPLYVQYGQFFGFSLGHGTIVDRYNNSLDYDHPKPGLAVAINRDGGGLAVFTDNIAGSAMNIVAGRGYIRPLAAFNEDPGFIAKRWAVGLTYAMDRNAHMLPGVKNNATVFGVDTEFKVFQNSVLELVPYVDLNYQLTDSHAGGLHVGALAKFRFPLVNVVNMWARLELRVTQPGYIPGYFDTVYDLQRVQFPATDTKELPKAAAGREIAPHGPLGMTALNKGVYGEAAFDVLKIINGGAAYFMTPGVEKSSNITLFATLPVFSSFKFSGYYIRRNFDSMKELWKLDERSLIMGTAMYKVWGPLWLNATFTRRWVGEYAADDVNHEHDPVKFKGVNEFNAGVTAQFPL